MMFTIAILFVICWTQINAQNLYVFPTTEDNEQSVASSLATMNTETGEIIEQIGATGLPAIHQATFCGSTLYGVSQVDDTCLYEFDLESGAGSLVGCDESFDPRRIRGLAADSNDNLYAAMFVGQPLNQQSTATAVHLLTVNKANGEMVDLGEFGAGCVDIAMAFGPDDVLYVDLCRQLGSVDINTLTFTPIGAQTMYFAATDLSFDPITQQMYANALGQIPGGLFSVNLETGVLTSIGPYLRIPSLACK